MKRRDHCMVSKSALHHPEFDPIWFDTRSACHAHWTVYFCACSFSLDDIFTDLTLFSALNSLHSRIIYLDSLFVKRLKTSPATWIKFLVGCSSWLETTTAWIDSDHRAHLSRHWRLCFPRIIVWLLSDVAWNRCNCCHYRFRAVWTARW